MTDQLQGLTRVAAHHWTEADLAQRAWRFGPVDRPPYANYVKLLPNGDVAGELGDNEARWRVVDGQLQFLDRFDRISTKFDQAFLDEEGRFALAGEFLQPPGLAHHVLREVAAGGRLAPSGAGLELIHRPPATKRRNLVVLRANERSLHTQWPRDITDEDRSWDLCLSSYAAKENFGHDDFAEYQVHHKGMKLEALHQLLHKGSPLWDYDYITLPDDDLMMSWRDLNELFAICRRFELDLAQPSLDPAGVHVAHPITRRNERFLLRYVSFVEVMMPVFSRDALLTCVGTFGETQSGFGADNVWPKLLGEPLNRMAIIDKVAVLHTRPQGANYDVDGAIAEGNRLQHGYHAPSRVLEYGGIRANRRDMQMWASPAVDELW